MTETTHIQLEQKRFVVNLESMTKFKKLAVAFLELKQEYPWLSGLGFFGSRTKGKDRMESDFDICVFYNTNRMNALSVGVKQDWNQIIEKLEQQASAKLDRRLKDWAGGLRIDISQEATKSRLKMFKDAAKPHIDQDIDDGVLNAVGIPPTQDLYSRFFLVVGDEVYENRKYILDQLKASPDGEKYFQILMKSLAWFERQNDDQSKPKTPNYEGYPTTLEEAENYFLSNSLHISKDQKNTT